jgi:hypothetical protein
MDNKTRENYNDVAITTLIIVNVWPVFPLHAGLFLNENKHRLSICCTLHLIVLRLYNEVNCSTTTALDPVQQYASRWAFVRTWGVCRVLLP